MARSFPRLAPLLLAALAAAACRTPAPQGMPPVSPPSQEAPQPAPPIRLTLVATNDVHGWVDAHQVTLEDGRTLREGGLPTFAGYLRILRKQNPGGVLLLDGGDLFQGTLSVNLTEGAVVVEAFNHLGYTAAALGNHEFDYGPLGPVSAATEPTQDAFGALKARFAEARFPFLATNIYDAATGERPTWLPNDGTALLEVKGLKVGIFGLITPQTPFTTNPVNVAGLRFGSLLPEARVAAHRLRQRGADLVIAVAHAGGKCGSLEKPDDVSSCDLDTGEIWEVLQGLPPGTLDAVVAGHTHQPLAHIVNDTPVVETSGLGRSFALLELQIDPRSKRVLRDRTVLTPDIGICAEVDSAQGGCRLSALKARAQAGTLTLAPATFQGEPVTPDPALDAILSRTRNRVAAEQTRPLGLTAPELLWRNYEAESALGSFLADSLRDMEGADVALLNSGGLRADLPKGPLRYGDVYEVLPFDNTVATVTVTGEELRRLLQAAYGARKGVFQVSGLKVTLDACPGPLRLREFTLPNGKALEPRRKYKVTLPDFLARGGDGLGPVLSSLPPGRIDLGTARNDNFREALIRFWQKRGQVLTAPKLGRLSILPASKPCQPGASH